MLTTNFSMLVQVTVWNYHISFPCETDISNSAGPNGTLSFTIENCTPILFSISVAHSIIAIAQKKIFKCLLSLMPFTICHKILLTLPSKYTQIHITSHNLHGYHHSPSHHYFGGKKSLLRYNLHIIKFTHSQYTI